jgi:hypothetical protein
LLYFGSVSLLVGAHLLIISTVVKRPNPVLQLRDRPREIGQVPSDKGYVPLDCHFGPEV